MPSPKKPTRSAELMAGDFWAIPLSDGRFACGRVLGFSRPDLPLASVTFIGGLLDWTGSVLPTSESIANAQVLESAGARVSSVSTEGCQIVGHRDLSLDGLIEQSEISGFWGDGYAKHRAEHRFVRGNPPPLWERREVASPLTDEMLRPFSSPMRVVQFKSMLIDDDFATLSDWLSGQPDVQLRAYGSYDGSITDLEFLEYFPQVNRFSADALFHSLRSLDGLRHLSTDLVSLTIGRTKAKLDLRILERFESLQKLYIEGQTKGLEVVAQLKSLDELTLRSITLPDLSLLTPLHRLRALDLKLGGTRDLGLLPEIGELAYIELWMIKGLSDISAVARIPTLQFLFLQSQAQITVLPSFAENASLRCVHLETMKGIRNLAPVAAAPALDSLLVIDCPQFGPADFAPFVGHPTLRSARIGTGSRKRNDAIKSLLGLQDAPTRSWKDVYT
jgi:hypothetical protein